MKPKTILGITIALLLLALPVSASDSTNASNSSNISNSLNSSNSISLFDSEAVSNITLSVCGNANRDETIDMKDVEYAEKIILDSSNQLQSNNANNKTQLADATGDNSINMLDITQIELINLGKAKKLTLVDGVGRQVNVNLPVKRIIPTDYRTTETLLALGTGDMIVGVDKAFHERMSEFGLIGLPEVGMHGQSVDYEMVLTLKPDIVLLPLWQAESADEIAKNLPNTSVVVIGLASQKTIYSDLKTMGFVIGKEKEANDLISWMQGYETLVKERTKDLKSDDMPSFYYDLYPETNRQQTIEQTTERTPNLNPAIVNQIAEKLGLTFTNEKETTENTFAPIDILDYIYAVLHSPTYREKYKEFLKIDFPRVPYPKAPSPSERAGGEVFWQLVKLGGELRQIHLLESPTVEKFITQYPMDGDNVVIKPRFQNSPPLEGCPQDGVVSKVYINDSQYFDNVPEIAWNFYIGGYQPAQKWLKDRKDRKLEFEDILHYQKIIVALTETDRLMKEIDKVMEIEAD